MLKRDGNKAVEGVRAQAARPGGLCTDMEKASQPMA